VYKDYINATGCLNTIFDSTLIYGLMMQSVAPIIYSVYGTMINE
jgi:hypothetical protein